MTEDKTKGKDKAEDDAPELKDVFEAALKAYGIAKKYVLGCGIDRETDVATIVTHGGAKVIYKLGDEVEPLPQVLVTGIRQAAARKPITGGK